jgi:hypothetical protein
MLTQTKDAYSDLYKEAHGSRPRHDTSKWTDDQWQSAFETLERICAENDRIEAEAQQYAIEEFEARVINIIARGAKDRAAAIRWMADAFEVGEDMGYLCYKMGLPYGYIA